MRTIEEKLIAIKKINEQIDDADRMIRIVQNEQDFHLHVSPKDIDLCDAIYKVYADKKILLMAEASELMK